MGLVEDAKAWKEAREKQAQDIADRLRSTAHAAAPALERGAELVSPTVAAPAILAGGVLSRGLTPTAPTAEDKDAITLPPTPPPADTQAAQPAPTTFAMPTAQGGGGSSRASTSVTEGVKLAPGTTALLDQSGQEQRSAIRHAGEAEQQGIDLTADQAKRTALFQGAQQVETALDPKTLHISHQIDEERQKLKDMQDEKIDAKHFQKSQTLGERLAWAISMGLGGFAAGMKGTTNTAAQLYSQAIQDDLDAQRSNLSRKTELQKGLLGDLQTQFKDKQQQDAAAQITGLNIFKTKLAGEGADSKSAAVKANVERETAAADNLLAQQHAKFDEATSSRVTKNYESVSGGAGGKGITPQEIADKRLEIIKMFQATGKPFSGQQVDAYLAQLYGGGGGQLPDIAKAKTGADAGIDTTGLKSIADNAAGVKAKDVVLSFLPSWLAPESANAAQKVASYHSTMRGTLKSLEPRLADDELERQAEAYDIAPSMPPDVAKQRVDSFIARVQSSNAAKKASMIDAGSQ